MASFIWRSVVTWFSPTYYNFLTDTDETKHVKLIKKTQITHDTIELTFELPTNMVLGLDCGQHLVCYCGETSRKYTPTETRIGSFDLVVKVYPDGILGNHMNKLNIGDELYIAGRPVGKNLYLGNGEFAVSKHTITSKSFAFICAGSGITPIYAILRKIVENNDTHIEAKVLYVNKTHDDIILRDKLDAIDSENENISVRYSLTRPDADWSGLKGRPTREMIEDFLSKEKEKEKEQVVVICGSYDFNSGISQMCIDLGVAKEYIVKF
jgi:NAD(P)H-flavin reductase